MPPATNQNKQNYEKDIVISVRGIEIVLSDSNDGVLYKWYDKICRRWQEIKYTMRGRAYFTIYGRRYYLDEFMRLNLWGR